MYIHLIFKILIFKKTKSMFKFYIEMTINGRRLSRQPRIELRILYLKPGDKLQRVVLEKE